jgi:hypothetical protein
MEAELQAEIEAMLAGMSKGDDERFVYRHRLAFAGIIA